MYLLVLKTLVLLKPFYYFCAKLNIDDKTENVVLLGSFLAGNFYCYSTEHRGFRYCKR